MTNTSKSTQIKSNLKRGRPAQPKKESIFKSLINKWACMHDMQIIKERKGGVYECKEVQPKAFLEGKNNVPQVPVRTFYEYDYYLFVCYYKIRLKM
jgi:hypothetical protein